MIEYKYHGSKGSRRFSQADHSGPAAPSSRFAARLSAIGGFSPLFPTAVSAAPPPAKRQKALPRSRGEAEAPGQGRQTEKKTDEFRFFCEACHKGYRNPEAYQLHLDDHEPCMGKDCTFEACAAVMKEHMLIHNPVVQSWMNMTDEEVAQWREDRRRNWPTEENIARKKREQEQEEKERRAQPVETRKRREIEFKRRPKPSLLEGLFANERRIEADLLIQCFEFIKSKSLQTSEANMEGKST